jgi:SAM-dependent MidA family methyltransferase
MERSLYGPGKSYYHGVPGDRDYATSVRISPVFGYALARLVSEFASRIGDGLFGIVDMGCGDGALLNRLLSETPEDIISRARIWGIDRAVPPHAISPPVGFAGSLEELPQQLPLLVISNELFDALPYARLVQRDAGLRELYVTEEEGKLDWDEQPAEECYVEYARRRGMELQSGQFADVSLEWGELYSAICEMPNVAMVVTFDYGFPQKQLFDPRFRRFGTAAAYYRHQVSRDLLARPGEQDLTAHVNFTDLIDAGEARGFATLAFLRQAEFLLRLGIAEHPMFAGAAEVEVASLEEAVLMEAQRESARRLVLPDGIGEDIRALVQARGVSLKGWSFQRRLWDPVRTDSD